MVYNRNKNMKYFNKLYYKLLIRRIWKQIEEDICNNYNLTTVAYIKEIDIPFVRKYFSLHNINSEIIKVDNYIKITFIH